MIQRRHPLLLSLLVPALLTGCAALVPEQAPTDAPDANHAEPAPSYNPDKERAALFNQPYIDPLTDYLNQHEGDAVRSALLADIEKERDARCEEIANEYAARAATPANLNSYRAGYEYSCPNEVAAFAARVQQVPGQEATGSSEEVSQELADCLLLTSIKNYTEARKACATPAAEGNLRAQGNMAVIEHAFENYSEAYQWADRTSRTSASSAYLLGRMYLVGEGVEANQELAMSWFRRAAELGHDTAGEMLKTLSESQGSGQLE